METQPLETLQLAFRHLDTFSIPGVGTFRKKYFPARIDTENKRMYPPTEEYVLEPGDEFVAILENFFFRFYKIKIDRAKEMVGELKDFVQEKLEEGGSVAVGGVGTLSLDGESNYLLEADRSEEGRSPNLFGLPELEYTLGQKAAPKADPKSEPEVVRTPTPAVIVPEQEPPRSVAAAVSKQGARPEAPKEERSRAGLYAFLFLLLAMIVTSAVVFRSELSSGLDQLGWFSGGEDPDPNGETPLVVDSLAGSDSSQQMASLTGPEDDTLPDEVVQDSHTEEDGVVVDDPSLESPVVDNAANEDSQTEEPPQNEVEEVLFDETLGSRPADGQYYLIVASTKDPEDAKYIARSSKGQILRPRFSGNYYRISAFNSTDKAAVIEKMVELKSRFEQSWIYWNGM